MVLILLRDGTNIEVAQCRDVIHKLTFLFCVDALDAPLLCLPTEDVLAYTMNHEVASCILDNADRSAGVVATET